MARYIALMGGLAFGCAAVTANAAFAESAVRLIQEFRADLDGFEEVPPVSTSGSGRFDAELFAEDGELAYKLTYSRLESPVAQAHIHFGQAGVNGGITVFLCTNLDNGPDGTQGCPEGGGEVSGTITSDDVIGPEAQGISPGEFAELLEAMLERATYVNVHTVEHGGGEIRGEVRPQTPAVQSGK